MEQELQKLLGTAPEGKLDVNRYPITLSQPCFQYWKKEFDGFKNLFARFLRAKSHIDWEKIEPLHEGAIAPYAEVRMMTWGDSSEVLFQLTRPEKEALGDLLNKLVVVKLNGGLGTSMGCKGPKSVISVRNDLTFLDLTMQQIQVRFDHDPNEVFETNPFSISTGPSTLVCLLC